MGVFVKLSIVPNQITQEQWRSVYQEAAQLIHAYPFLDIFTDEEKYDCKWSYAARPKEHKISYRHDELGFCLIGDLLSMQQAESFELIKSLDYYRKHVEKENNCKDVLQIYLDPHGDNVEIRRVFDDKTQGYDYHKYVLAIACLFESRLTPFALVDGDISKGQMNDSIAWANSILEKPILISQRADNTVLLARLKTISEDEPSIFSAFMDATLNEFNNDLGLFIRENFNHEVIAQYYAEKIRVCRIGTFGFSTTLYHYLNLGHDLGKFCEICITDKHKNIEDVTVFIRMILDTGITLDDSDERMHNKEFSKVTQLGSTLADSTKPDTVFSLFGKSLGILSGHAVRQTDMSIKVDDLICLLEEKIGKVFDIKAIVDGYFLKKQKDREKDEKSIASLASSETMNDVSKEKFDIDDLDELIHWQEGDTIHPHLQKFIFDVKNFIDNINLAKEISFQEFSALNNRQKMKMLIERNRFFVLKREFWDYVETHLIEWDKVRKIYRLFSIDASGMNIYRMLVSLLNNIPLLEKFMLDSTNQLS